MERKLATIRRILDIKPIEGADLIELAYISGWQCVTAKTNGFKKNNLCIYFEIDSVLPELEDTEFLRSKNFRIRTIKLKGQLSQGIIFPLEFLKNFTEGNSILEKIKSDEISFEGYDLSEIIGVEKYEAPIPACLGGQIEGYFPNKVPKTDAERCLSENCLIETEDGIKTIKEICETRYNGKIKSYDFVNNNFCWETIIDYHILRNNNDWYEIELDNGYKIQLTETHPVYLKNLMCFRKVNELVIGDILFTKD